MKKILFPLLLLAVSTTFAKDAGKAETPEQIVQKLYRVYQEENATDNGVSFDDYASAEIKALFAKDEKLADGEMGCIDYDFIIQGQDYDAASIKRTLKIKTLDKNTVAATFKNFDEPTTVTYQFDCTTGKCQITDLLEPGGENKSPRSFKKSLADCLANVEKNGAAQ